MGFQRPIHSTNPHYALSLFASMGLHALLLLCSLARVATATTRSVLDPAFTVVGRHARVPSPPCHNPDPGMSKLCTDQAIAFDMPGVSIHFSVTGATTVHATMSTVVSDGRRLSIVAQERGRG